MYQKLPFLALTDAGCIIITIPDPLKMRISDNFPPGRVPSRISEPYLDRHKSSPPHTLLTANLTGDNGTCVLVRADVVLRRKNKFLQEISRCQ